LATGLPPQLKNVRRKMRSEDLAENPHAEKLTELPKVNKKIVGNRKAGRTLTLHLLYEELERRKFILVLLLFDGFRNATMVHNKGFVETWHSGGSCLVHFKEQLCHLI
jgi:hypothetical protein